MPGKEAGNIEIETSPLKEWEFYVNLKFAKYEDVLDLFKMAEKAGMGFECEIVPYIPSMKVGGIEMGPISGNKITVTPKVS